MKASDFGNQAMSNLDQTQDGSGTEYPFVYGERLRRGDGF